jgi:hypothetical protein
MRMVHQLLHYGLVHLMDIMVMDVAYVEDRMDTHLYYCTHTVASLYYHE